jgi:hypothetical protein
MSIVPLRTMLFFFAIKFRDTISLIKMSENSTQNLIQALGAGDLIDRAIRLYRQNFWTFIFIASPPIIFATFFSLGWTLLGRQVFSVGTAKDYDNLIYYNLFSWLGGAVIWFIETVAVLVIMGGASRNFVRHLLWFEPITLRETYANVWKKPVALILASFSIVFLLSILGYFVLNLGSILIFLVVILCAAMSAVSTILAWLVGIILSLAIAFLTLWLFFLLASKFAYIPQIMLVEGQSFGIAIGRSVSLASGNVKRFAGLFTFTILATYSALSILYIPLGWYAYANGIEIISFDQDLTPAWYAIATQLISQVSFVLLTPIWMLGLSLLYVDDRVRHEGYDVELMAARMLGEIPPLPPQYANPLQPAISTGVKTQPVSDNSMLGLN